MQFPYYVIQIFPGLELCAAGFIALSDADEFVKLNRNCYILCTINREY
jgi:hypothetical protein